MNVNLKKALIDRGIPAYRTAQEIEMNPSKMSQIVCGIASPSTNEKRKLAKILNCRVEEIFPETGV